MSWRLSFLAPLMYYVKAGLGHPGPSWGLLEASSTVILGQSNSPLHHSAHFPVRSIPKSCPVSPQHPHLKTPPLVSWGTSQRTGRHLGRIKAIWWANLSSRLSPVIDGNCDPQHGMESWRPFSSSAQGEQSCLSFISSWGALRGVHELI